MEIAFDPAKREATLRERGLDVLDAPAVLATAVAAFEDARFAYPEPRIQTSGFLHGRLLAVVTTPIDNGIRLISMRKANEREQARDTGSEWLDPGDAPEMTDEMLEMGQVSVGGRVMRPATGVLTTDGMKRVPSYTIPIPGRPPERGEPKKQVTLRLDADLLDHFRSGGPGWQSRINATLRKALGM